MTPRLFGDAHTRREDLECHVQPIGSPPGWGQACNLHILEGNSRSSTLQLEHHEKNKHGGTCNKVEHMG